MTKYDNFFKKWTVHSTCKIHAEAYFEQVVRLQICADTQKRNVSMNKQQRSILKTSFNANYNPNKTTIKKLALTAGLTEGRVCSWFKDARYRTRQETFQGKRSIRECIC